MIRKNKRASTSKSSLIAALRSVKRNGQAVLVSFEQNLWRTKAYCTKPTVQKKRSEISA